MIRFGPAAAPRWFDSSTERLPDYLDLIVASGGSQVEFVLLPGAGSPELGRVHLLQHQWSDSFKRCQERDVRVNLHAPLLPEFGVARADSDDYWRGYQPVLDAVRQVDSMQSAPPVLVVHADGSRPDVTTRFLDRVLNQWSAANCRADVAIELRAGTGAQDDRFDRLMDTLVAALEPVESDRAGICWDVAHEWESTARISALDPELARWIRHVHIHDNRPDRTVHAPLGAGEVPWSQALRELRNHGYRASVTLEIRYRYASEYGEPWNVLKESLLAVNNLLSEE